MSRCPLTAITAVCLCLGGGAMWGCGQPAPVAIEKAASAETADAAPAAAAAASDAIGSEDAADTDAAGDASAEAAAPPAPETIPPADAVAAETPGDEPFPNAAPVASEQAARGRELYAAHCAACHGDAGDGQGIAAPFLFPKPRNLQAGNFRLVSTDNNVPTREDLHSILSRGMPGSTMPPWAHLPQEDREALVDEVLRIRREGVRTQYARVLVEDEGLTPEEMESAEVQAEIQQHVTDFTTPGAPTEVPPLGEPTPEGLARGKQAYAKYGCVSCHGAEGRGDGVEAMADIEQMPTSPRDFTLGIFKGNPDPVSLYRRIAFGMPGTPMPGSSAMTPDERVDLVHYVLSLSSAEQRSAAVLQRRSITALRVAALGDLQQDAAWASAEPAALNMTPLWWRTTPDPGLQVQALHDGERLAIRLSWRDASTDSHSLQSESFKDAAAVQIFSGEAEPFLGMGAVGSPVDVWFWDADRQNAQATVEDVHPRMVVDAYPFSEAAVSSAELSRDTGSTAVQPDISLPARAAGNQIVPPIQPRGGSSLRVGGPGTVTFRPPQNQLVEAAGVWKDGQWTVVMIRPLAMSSDSDGLALKPGQRVSASFAIWDGDRRDRDGQKLITIWQDLQLAP